MTDLAEDEILCEIRVPAFRPKTGYAYEKLKRKTGDWATAAAAVVMQMRGDRVESVRIALTNVASTALRAREAEQTLTGRPLDDEAVATAAAKSMAICDPAEDLRGDRQYKVEMAGQMVRRALGNAAARCR
jgi:carbon-monoxide dehydrogenase medium subunit